MMIIMETWMCRTYWRCSWCGRLIIKESQQEKQNNRIKSKKGEIEVSIELDGLGCFWTCSFDCFQSKIIWRKWRKNGISIGVNIFSSRLTLTDQRKKEENRWRSSSLLSVGEEQLVPLVIRPVIFPVWQYEDAAVASVLAWLVCNPSGSLTVHILF